jgi:hypothetical protein
MGISGIRKAVTALAVALVGGLVITAAASADSAKVRFNATAEVVGVGSYTPAVSTFHLNKKGAIKSVDIVTDAVPGELVATGPLTAECKGGEAAEALCAGLNVSTIVSFHGSSATLTQVQVIPNPVPIPGLPDVLAGKVKGELDGSFDVIALHPDTFEPIGLLPGTAHLKIKGDAVYGCFGVIANPPPPGIPVLAPAPIAECQAGVTWYGATAALYPIVLDVNDTGKFELFAGLGVFTGVTSGHGKVKVDAHVEPSIVLTPDGPVVSPAASGTVTIKKGVVYFGEPGPGDDEGDDEGGDD